MKKFAPFACLVALAGCEADNSSQAPSMTTQPTSQPTTQPTTTQIVVPTNVAVKFYSEHEVNAAFANYMGMETDGQSLIDSKRNRVILVNGDELTPAQQQVNDNGYVGTADDFVANWFHQLAGPYSLGSVPNSISLATHFAELGYSPNPIQDSAYHGDELAKDAIIIARNGLTDVNGKALYFVNYDALAAKFAGSVIRGVGDTTELVCTDIANNQTSAFVAQALAQNGQPTSNWSLNLSTLASSSALFGTTQNNLYTCQPSDESGNSNVVVEFYSHSGNTPAEVLVSTQASDVQPAVRSFEFNGTSYDMAGGGLLTVSDADGHDVKVQQVIKDSQGSVLASSEHYASRGTIKSIAIADVPGATTWQAIITEAYAGTYAPGSSQGCQAAEVPLNSIVSKSLLNGLFTSEQAASDTPVAEVPADWAEQERDYLTRNNTAHFDLGAATLLAETKDIINAHVSYLIGNPDAKISVQGHADDCGTSDYNLTLSEQRAEAIRHYMTFKGVKADQIETINFGDSRPISVDPSLNRRVEIHYLSW